MSVAQTGMLEAQQGIYALLAPGDVLDATLTSLGMNGVYDEVPQDTDVEYIVFETANELPDDTMGKRGFDVVVQLNIYSRKLGFYALHQVLDRMNALIVSSVPNLTLPTLTHCFTKYYGSSQMRDNDKFGTRIVPVKYQVFLEQP